MLGSSPMPARKGKRAHATYQRPEGACVNPRSAKNLGRARFGLKALLLEHEVPPDLVIPRRGKLHRRAPQEAR